MTVICLFVHLVMMASGYIQPIHHFIDYDTTESIIDFEGAAGSRPKRCNEINLIDQEEQNVHSGSKAESLELCTFSPAFIECASPHFDEIFQCLAEPWSCIIGSDEICDGSSICLTDECECEDSGIDAELFFCADGTGCVTLYQTCDGTYDCLDKSDELVCDELEEFACWSEENATKTIKLQFSRFLICSEDKFKVAEITNRFYPFTACNSSSYCDGFDITTSKAAENTTKSECLQELDSAMVAIINGGGTIYTHNITDVCKNLTECKNSVLPLKSFCQNLRFGGDNSIQESTFSFECMMIFDQIVPWLVCDGNYDCVDQSDELIRR